MNRRPQDRTRAMERPSHLPWMLAAALIVLALAIFTGQAQAAGSDSGSSDDSGSSYNNPAMSKSMRKAAYLIKKEDYTAALAHLETEIAADPDNADAWNLTGFAARKLGDYGRSEAAYDRALAINPKHKGALEYKGELYLTLGNLEGAEALLARLSKSCYFNCAEKKQLAAAIDAYKKAN
ncbi:MAG: tetratricopeptide repeat protein [Pseudomonadota bacterium]|nr:tetratricopeptide repeat protein [Pseudomonadota bacterium]